MSESMWQQAADDEQLVEPSPAAPDPMQALQQAAAGGQPGAQAAAVAVDALVKFLAAAAPVAPIALELPQIAQPVAAAPQSEPAPVPVVPEPVADAPAPEPEPTAPQPEPAPVPVAPEPSAPQVESEPQGEVVELWPSAPVDENARMRSEIDDALMPRSLPVEEQLEFRENSPDRTPAISKPPALPTFAPPAPEPDPEPEVATAEPAAEPAPEPAAALPEPAAPVQEMPVVAVAAPVTSPTPVVPVEQPVPVQEMPVVAVAAPVPSPTPVVPVEQPVPAAQMPVVPVAHPVAPVMPVLPVPAEPVQQAVPVAAPAAPVLPVMPVPVEPPQQAVPAVPVVPVAPPVAHVVPVVPVVPVATVTPPASVQPVAVAEPVTSPPAPEPALPFWKREVSLGGKKKKTKKPQQQQPQQQQQAAAPAPAAAGPAVPFWKREVSFGKKKQPAEAKSTTAKKQKTSLFKREIDFASIANRPIGHQEGTTEGLEKIVGLRIGSSQLAAALVSNNGSAQLVRVARSPLRPGLVVDGEVHDAEGLTSALKSFFSANKLPRKGVRIGVATNRIGVRVMEVPAVDDPKAAANAIRFRAQEVLPFPLNEAVVDHVDIGEGPNGSRRVLIAFAHRGLIDQYVEACKKAKLRLAGIDFDAFALLRAVTARRAEGEQASSALVALAIGHERTIFAVSDGDVCEFTRVLDWGGAAVDKALAEALDLTPEEAEQVKLGLSLSGDEAHPDLTPEAGNTARRAVRDSLQLLARELVSSLQFYQSRAGSLDIGDVLVTGGGAGLNGLEDELTRMLGVPVRTADPFAGVTIPAGVQVPEQSGSLTIAVGLAIEEQH